MANGLWEWEWGMSNRPFISPHLPLSLSPYLQKA
jgi:hypothetical protein